MTTNTDAAAFATRLNQDAADHQPVLHRYLKPSGLEGIIRLSSHSRDYLDEVRLFVCRGFTPGVMHVGTGTTPMQAERECLHFAVSSGSIRGKRAEAAFLAQLHHAEGAMKLMPRVTHIGVGPMGSAWEGGVDNAQPVALVWRDALDGKGIHEWQLPDSKHVRCGYCRTLLVDAAGKPMEYIEHDRHCARGKS